jgi:prolyl oligopeptidase
MAPLHRDGVNSTVLIEGDLELIDLARLGFAEAWIGGAKLVMFKNNISAGHRRTALCLAIAASAACCGGPRAPARDVVASRPAGAVAAAAVSPAPAPPARRAPPQGATRRLDLNDVRFGKTIDDPYRWLEDSSDDGVRAWIATQNAYTRRVLDSEPHHAALEASVTALRFGTLLGVPEVRTDRAGGRRYFRSSPYRSTEAPSVFMRREPPTTPRSANPRADGPAAAPEVAVLTLPAAELDHAVSLSYWRPSPNGALIAYGTSNDGDEEDTLYVHDVDAGRDLPVKIEDAVKSAVVWAPRSDAFYYTRLPKRSGATRAPGELAPVSLYRHQMGTPVETDARVAFAAEPVSVRAVSLSPDGRRLAILGYDDRLYVRDIAKNADLPGSPLKVPAALDVWLSNDGIVLRTTEHAAHGELIAIPYAQLRTPKRTVVLAESVDALEHVWRLGRSFIARYSWNYGPRFVSVTEDGKLRELTPPPGVTFAGAVSTDEAGREAFFLARESKGDAVVLRMDGPSGGFTEWQREKRPGSATGIVAERLWASSRDGTAIPVDVYHQKGLAEDGQTPTILFGYGGFAFNFLHDSASNRALAGLGFTIAIAGLRGGSELGDAWHTAAVRDTKQHTFDDAIAIAELLIARRYTDPAHLAVFGGSNGGLLVGALVTQRPDLFRVAVAMNGLFDMIRYPKLRIGKLWISEYGDPDLEAELPWLLAYSPYHHVRDGEAYPAVLFTSSENDPRVDPAHSRKMAAALQAASSSDRPILLHEAPTGGHGHGAQAANAAALIDGLAFIVSQIGMPAAPAP